MFSSLQNAPLIKRSGRIAPMKTAWKCPTCGKKALIRVKKPYRLYDGAVIPKLDRLQCQSCKEEVFDLDAMYAIEEFRRFHPRARSAAKRHERQSQQDREA
jgi:hypothetical protein